MAEAFTWLVLVPRPADAAGVVAAGAGRPGCTSKEIAMPPALEIAGVRLSPLVLADRLITLAQKADLAGYRQSASRLIVAAHAVLDEESPALAA